MTLEEAKEIVYAYSDVLAKGPIRDVSELPASKERTKRAILVVLFLHHQVILWVALPSSIRFP